EGDNERSRGALVILVDDHAVFVEKRRAGGAVIGVHLRKRLMPDLLAGEIDAQDAVVAEIGVDALAIGGRRARGMAILVLARLRLGIGGESFPKLLAVVAGQAQDRTAFAVVVGRGQEDAVFPDDRRRVAGAGQIDFPEDIFGIRPFIGI